MAIENGWAGQSAVFPTHFHGGGIHNHGRLRLTNSAISVNNATHPSYPSGGGIANAATGVAELANVIVSHNAAKTAGGIENNGELYLNNVSIDANSSWAYGGGITNAHFAALTNVTISRNAANSAGGGIVNNGQLVLNNVTIANNEAPSGGGIYNGNASTNDTVRLRNTIVADNDTRGLNCASRTAVSGIIDEGFNLQHSLQIRPNPRDCGQNIVVNDPQLSPVFHNTGSVSSIIYFGLSPSSPAVEAGNPAGPGSQFNACAPQDQRGISRPQDGDSNGIARCDIGAIELQSGESFSLTVVRNGSGNGTVTSSPAGINCPADCSEYYAANTAVVLTPTPVAGSVFAGWSGDNPDCSDGAVTMSTAMTCIATSAGNPLLLEL